MMPPIISAGTYRSLVFSENDMRTTVVRGELGTITGEVPFDQVDPSRSRVSATIDATEINTRNPDRDAHLRSSDFLDVARHPTVSFRSTAIVQREPGKFDVTGALTIRGVTKAVTLDAEVSDEVQDPWGNAKRGVTASARIDRKDFGPVPLQRRSSRPVADSLHARRNRGLLPGSG